MTGCTVVQRTHPALLHRSVFSVVEQQLDTSHDWKGQLIILAITSICMKLELTQGDPKTK